MAYLALLWKARTIEKCRLKYEKEKINSILAANTELPRSTLYQKWNYRTASETRLGTIYSNLYPEGSKIATSFSYVKENSRFLLRNVIGVVGGIVLLYFSCKIFVFELAVWSIMGWALGVVIMMGLVFSYRVRCLVLLMVPGLFSRVGRYTLACYALVLILTGPATNTIKNLDTLSECLACGQEQIKTSLRQMKESRASSLNLVQETMNATIEKIQYLATKMKEILVKIHRLTMSIAHVLQSSLSWLNSVENTCNKELGTAYHHCIKTLARETENSEKNLVFSGVLKLDDVIQAACLSLKSADPLCMVGDFTKGSIVATVKNKLMTYSSLIQSLLSVAVHIRRSHYHPCCNGSAPVNQAAASLVTDLRNRADPILTWLSWSCTLTGLFLLLTIFRAKYYQFMFRTRSRFDNRYITKELRELDLKRQQQGRETALPLNTRERVKYVSTASLRLLPSERTYLARSIVYMIITTLKLLIHMVADYSLYWVLMNIRSHGSTEDSQPTDRTADIIVQGSGPLAATVRMLLEALSVPLALPTSSPKSCLPNPHPPDLERYAQIGILILSLWLLALFEPYGLRLRHVITGHYQPERAKARAVWLYYHIIRTRNCFLKYARRKLHREYKYTSEEKFTFKRWLSDCIPCRWLHSLLGLGPKKKRCLLCCTKHRQEEPDRLLKTCETPSCPGVYCARCFMDIGQLCTICYSPEDYGDLSDVSLERFSSDDSGDDDGDDDHEGDNKPLLGTSDYVIKGDENDAHTKVTKNRKQKSMPSRKNDNQESLPLLDCDSLNKDYTQEKKARFAYVYRVDKVDKVSTQQMFTRLKTNQRDCSNKKNPNNNQVSPLQKESTCPKNLEITIKGVRIPKERLGAIIRTMMLLTAKIHDEYIENENYSKYEPFQSTSVIEKCFRRHTRCDKTEGSNMSLKTEITFLDLMLPRKLTSSTINLATVSTSKNSEPNHKDIQDNSQENSKNKKIMKRKNNKRARKRNMKRFLEIRKLIATHVTQRMRKRRMNFNKRKISWKRRRRRCNSCKNLNLLMRITSKVFTNKTIKKDSSDNFFGIHNNIKSRQLSNKTSKLGKHLQQDTNHLAKNGMIVMHAAEWCSINKTYSLSSVATIGAFDFPSADAINNDSSLSKDHKEISTLEAEKEIGPLTSDQHITQIKNRKKKFWANLCLRITENQSSTFSSTTREKLLLNNLFWNHKRRKKHKMVDSMEINKARRVDDDARKYRISLFVKDQEWLKNAIKDNDILEEKNKGFFLGTVPRKGSAKEIKYLKTDEIKMKKREIDLELVNQSKLMEVDRKVEWDKEKEMGNNHHDEGPTGELDCKRNYKDKHAEKDSTFRKMLKKLSKTTLNLPKLHEVTRSVNVYYNSPHLELHCESKGHSEKRHKYTNNSDNKYKEGIKSGEHTVEDLKREIMSHNEQLKITSGHNDSDQLMTSNYNDNMSTDSKLIDSTKSVTSSVHEWNAQQKEHGCYRTERDYDNIKHTCRNAYHQAKSKPQKATNNRCTNIPTLDELLKNTKGIQINLSKYNKVTQTVNFYEPGPNVIHNGEYKFHKANCGFKDIPRKKMQRKKQPESNISLTNQNILEEQNYDNYHCFDDNIDVEKGEKKKKINQVIKEVFNNEEYASYVHNLSTDTTLHGSNESVTSCDHAHVWQLEPKTHGLLQSMEEEETSDTEPENTIVNRGTIISNITEVVHRSNEIRSVCNSINMTRRNPFENNSSKNKNLQDKCTSYHTQGSSDSKKCSRLRRWFQDRLCVSSSTKLKNIAKPNRSNLKTQTKRIPMEHTQTQCFCSCVCKNKQVSVHPAELIRNRNLNTQTHRTPVKHNQTQYCICTVCNCPREDNGLQTEKPEMSDFASQYRYPPYDVREVSNVFLDTENMNSSVTIEYTNEMSQTRKQPIWSVASTDRTTTSDTRTVDLSTTYDWWSPIVERKPVKADPIEISSSQSEWSFSKFHKQSNRMGSASDKWCMPVTAEEQSNGIKYFKSRTNTPQSDRKSRKMK